MVCAYTGVGTCPEHYEINQRSVTVFRNHYCTIPYYDDCTAEIFAGQTFGPTQLPLHYRILFLAK